MTDREPTRQKLAARKRRRSAVRHDRGQKLLFSYPEMVRDLIQQFVEQPWVQEVDFATLQRVNASYVSETLKQREDDLVWRVRWREQWVYVYLILEFQSTIDPWMALRMLVYVALLYQHLIKEGEVTIESGLPPVVPLVLYNGSQGWTAAREAADLVGSTPGGLEEYVPHMEYLLLEESRYSTEELSPLRNLAAALFRLENSQTAEEARGVIQQLAEWLKSPEMEGLSRAFAVWLAQVLLPSRLPGASLPTLKNLQEVNRVIEERSRDWFRPVREESLAEGRKEGEAAVLLLLLERRFGPIDEWVRERVVGADSDTLLRWAETILTARRVEDVLGD